MTTFDRDSYLMHYGILRRSGRYPWGSGQDPVTRSRDFLSTIDELKKQGLSETEIAKGMALYTENGKPWSTTDFRAARSIANNATKQADIRMAERLREKGYSNVKIGERMGKNESTVRSLLAPGAKDRADTLQTIANQIRDRIEEVQYLDVGKGIENRIGISKEKLNTAIAMLQEEGYRLHYVKVPQLGTTHDTSMKVLAKPDVTPKTVYANRDHIRTFDDFSDDGGRSFHVLQPPLSISAKRVAINYKEDGGSQADGVLYVRPGVKDVSIGNNRYAQVRVAVDGTHYLKGMAIYKDDLPAGVDIVFNTNKSNTGNKLDAMKPLQLENKDNPFGSNIRRQIFEKDERTGIERVSSVMNIVNEEGAWDKWSRNLSSQTLSKQSPRLAKQQLDMTFERTKSEFEAIKKLTNPAVRELLLDKFASGADSSAVHLKAAALPRSSWHVILPMNSLKETEVYAPNFTHGEKVALIRYPHAGTFEIPELTVNNRHPEAKALLSGQGKTPARDAIAINAKVAERLSGADFDGDAVLVIPNNSGSIKTSSPLRQLEKFDPQQYKLPDDAPRMSARTKGIQMGKVSNLITDMTLQKASTEEIAHAVKHSMVVIDAEKHHLDWKASSRDNGIPALMKKYQNSAQGGASTLISQRKSPIDVLDRKERPASQGGAIDPATGKKMYVPTGKTRLDRKTGLEVPVIIKGKRLEETDDAHTLSSGTPMETVYANHSNKLKALANEARKEQLKVKPLPVSDSAKKVYGAEVRSLNAKLNEALMNAPLERQAQVLANAHVKLRQQANPDMDAATLKKIKGQALETSRARVEARKQAVHITDREWEAIQAQAISTHKLKQILNNADIDRVRELATPRDTSTMTGGMLARAKTMVNSGYPQSEIAATLGVSVTTLKSHLGGETN